MTEAQADLLPCKVCGVAQCGPRGCPMEGRGLDDKRHRPEGCKFPLPPRPPSREAELREALRDISECHLGDCPVTMEELEFAKSHIFRLRKMARDALAGSAPVPAESDVLAWLDTLPKTANVELRKAYEFYRKNYRLDGTRREKPDDVAR